MPRTILFTTSFISLIQTLMSSSANISRPQREEFFLYKARTTLNHPNVNDVNLEIRVTLKSNKKRQIENANNLPRNSHLRSTYT